VTDVEVFFEAIGLEQVGEFEGADVAAAFPDLPLQINNHASEFLAREALMQQFIPLPFAHEVQPQFLAGQLAVEFMRLKDLSAIHGDGHGASGLCFQEAIRTNATRTSRLPCEFDELSYNVLHNQILKATMRRLIRAQDLATESTEGLAQLCRLFSDIEDIELTGRVFGRVQLYRNNQFYDFLLKVCELIY
jgi:hypothetical protein